MSHSVHSGTTQLGVIVFLVVLVVVSPQTFSYDLTIRLSDMTIPYNTPQGYLTVCLTNPADSILAFTVRLKLDRPDLIALDTTLDSAGTLTSGFALFRGRSISGTGTDMKIIAIADDDAVHDHGIGQSSAERTLLRIPFHRLNFPDTTSGRTTAVLIESQFLDGFCFSREDGTSIGLAYREIVDTTFFRCMNWAGSTCLSWTKVPGPPADSMEIIIDIVPYIDSSLVDLTDGQVTIGECFRTFADLDIDSNGLPFTIADYVTLLRYVGGDTSGIGNSSAADVNGDCLIDWGDVYKLDTIMRMVVICDPFPCRLPCSCNQQPVRKCCWQTRGNINGDINHIVDVSDLSYLVAYLAGTGNIALKCSEEANVNGASIIDVSDLSLLISYLTAGMPAALPMCP